MSQTRQSERSPNLSEMNRSQSERI
eukprot:COSAG05_NODE_20294_length_280_cov_1.425414_1_plen_24_part_01